jgi:hypothetical protein
VRDGGVRVRLRGRQHSVWVANRVAGARGTAAPAPRAGVPQRCPGPTGARGCASSGASVPRSPRVVSLVQASSITSSNGEGGAERPKGRGRAARGEGSGRLGAGRRRARSRIGTGAAFRHGGARPGEQPRHQPQRRRARPAAPRPRRSPRAASVHASAFVVHTRSTRTRFHPRRQRTENVRPSNRGSERGADRARGGIVPARIPVSSQSLWLPGQVSAASEGIPWAFRVVRRARAGARVVIGLACRRRGAGATLEFWTQV